MSAAHEDLGRRAVACRAWRWMPGMLTTDGVRMLNADRWEWAAPQRYKLDDRRDLKRAEPIPDLSDPATVGCVLALVREAWGDPSAYVAPGDGWYVGVGSRTAMGGSGPTEAAALVAALENAP